MAIAINFYLRTSKAKLKKEGRLNDKVGIILFISYNGIRVKICTIDSIEAKYWNEGNQETNRSYLESVEFNTRLNNIRSMVSGVYRTYVNNHDTPPTESTIKKMIVEKLNPTKNTIAKREKLNLLTFTEKFIQDTKDGKRLSDKGRPISPNTVKSYTTFKINLKEFQIKKNYNLDFDNIDSIFYEEFKNWMLIEKKYKTNSLAKYLKILKMISYEANLKDYLEKPFTGRAYNTQKEDVQNIYLDKAELKRIENLNLPYLERLDKVRDLFLLGCWTGLRFSDFSTIELKDIGKTYITKRTQKTDATVIIPIHPVVKKIIKKYNGLTENSLPPSISNVKFNLYIKEIAELAEIKGTIIQKFTKGGKLLTTKTAKHKLVTTHTARRSFATNAYIDGIDSLTIMGITGHTSDSSFMKYIKITQKQQAEKMHNYWINLGVYEDSAKKQE